MKFPHTATLHTAQGQRSLRLRIANGWWSRFRGLMLAAPLQTEPTAQALLITRCPSVHGFFMRYALDVIYLAAPTSRSTTDATQCYSVTHITTLRPWRISVGKRHRHQRSAHALELPAGSGTRWNIQPGDTLEIQA